MRMIDLSVALEDGLPVDPPENIVRIEYTDHNAGIESMLPFFPGATQADLPDGAGWAVETLHLGSHAGTHMDAPYHYHPTMDHGKPSWTIDQIPLEWCMGDGVMVDFLTSRTAMSVLPRTFRITLSELVISSNPTISFLYTPAPCAHGAGQNI